MHAAGADRPPSRAARIPLEPFRSRPDSAERLYWKRRANQLQRLTPASFACGTNADFPARPGSRLRRAALMRFGAEAPSVLQLERSNGMDMDADIKDWLEAELEAALDEDYELELS